MAFLEVIEQHHLFEVHSGRKLPNEIVLSVTDRYNEYVMTGLRTIWGVSIELKLNLGRRIRIIP
jgi:hypothetical protein